MNNALQKRERNKITNTKQKEDKMSWGIDFLQQGAQQAAGGIFGLAFGGASNKQQFKQQKKLTRLQLDAQQQMTDYNMMKQLEMWDKTNYKAQMQQLAKAGLNPGLIYGMGGGGGATASITGGNVGGGQAANHAGAMASMGATAAQMGLLRAQKENIEADTENKKATTPKLEAETKSITQGIENQKAQEELLKIQGGIQGVEEHIAKMTQNQVVARIGTELRTLTAQMHIWERQNKIDANTADEKIGIIEQELAEITARVLLTKAQTGKTKEETDKIAKEIGQMAQRLQNETDQVAIQQQLANFETNFGKQLGGVAATVLQALRGRR